MGKNEVGTSGYKPVENPDLIPAIRRDFNLDEEARLDGLRKLLEIDSDLLADRHENPATEVFFSGFSLDEEELAKIDGIEHYETRTLYKIGQLAKDPNLRLVIVTRKIPDQRIIDFYLNRFVDESSNDISLEDVKERLTFIEAKEKTLKLDIGAPAGDLGAEPKTVVHSTGKRIDSTTKIAVSNEATLFDIRQELNKTGGRGVIRCFNSSPHEVEAALKLDVPLYAPDAKTVKEVNGKSHGRVFFREAGVPLAEGREYIRTHQEMFKTLFILAEKGHRSAVIKLEDSFSGEGNLKIDLAKMKKEFLLDQKEGEGMKFSVDGALAVGKTEDLLEILSRVVTQHPKGVEPGVILEKFAEIGGIVEAWVSTPEDEEPRERRGRKTSPSVQMEILPGSGDDKIKIISSHEQILDGQTYQGASFPAERNYIGSIVSAAKKAGKKLQEAGVLGRVAADFIVTFQEEKNDWEGEEIWQIDSRTVEVYGVEFNIRKGGTTHPYEVTKLLTDGKRDKDGKLKDRHGREIFYIATDNIKKERLKGVDIGKFLEFLDSTGLLFDEETNQGIMPHLMSAIPEYGKFGFTAIAHSHEEARIIYDNFMYKVNTKWEDRRGKGQDGVREPDKRKRRTRTKK